ncbi:MAG: lysylphosphatidylglycerol synthase transmembrane domain-containing protein [Bacteroidota bacterium]
MNKANIVKTSNILIKILIIILSFGFIYYQLFIKYSSHFFVNSFKSLLSHPNASIVLLIVIFMMIFNWSIETLKWQYLIKKIERVSFFRAFSAVLAGLTVSSFTPNRTGEYFGRVFILNKANRWEGTFITFVGSISQLLVTLIVGSFSLLFCVVSKNPAIQINTHLVYVSLPLISFLVAALFSILYFEISWLKMILHKIIPKRYELFRSHLEIFSYYSYKNLLITLSYSFARYLVFSFQFYLLFRICNVPLPFFDGILIISCVFLIMTAIPTIALSELGVRGSVCIFLMENYFSANAVNLSNISSNAFIASGMIWFINLIIPAIIGGAFVLKLKFFRK